MIPEHILNKTYKNIFKNENNPICILKNLIISTLKTIDAFDVFEDLPKYVSVENNFDNLLIPLDHVSRSSTDSYYLNEKTLLRTHTSAHQYELLNKGFYKFLVIGDVYRRDEIDKYHFPVFHQLEGVKLFIDTPEQDIINDLKNTLTTLINKITNSEVRFVDSYFPFTNPSFEVEILFNGRWLEVLGCGVIQKQILTNAGIAENKLGWAFGLGLERLAMLLFNIPDIRYFWSEDPRFCKQFEKNKITQFKEYSKFPVCYKDISFWTDSDYNHNDFYEKIREISGDLIEDISIIDTFSKNNKTSYCYRLNYRHMDRSLTNEEINVLQNKIRQEIKTLNIELR